MALELGDVAPFVQLLVSLARAPDPGASFPRFLLGFNIFRGVAAKKE